jgi:hypothetical protein
MGFMTILHGDDRIYNNIIVQKYPVSDAAIKPNTPDHQVAGTSPFDIFPSYEEWISNFMMYQEPDMDGLAPYHFGHLPVWVGGNAYFNVATVSRHEKDGFIGKDIKADVNLAEEDDKLILKTNIYDALNGFRDGIIGSENLGKAFEPEQRFENPDGTEIIFNRDYFGNPRGLDTIPGPFAEAEDSTKPLW